MALIDAVANSINVPLWRLFGGVTSTLTTGITVEFNKLLCYNVLFLLDSSIRNFIFHSSL